MISRIFKLVSVALALSVHAPATFAAEPAPAGADAKSVAFLLVHFQNDNEELDPTSAAERARMESIREQFQARLTQSGRYTFLPVSDAQRAKFRTGQALGHCAGCEIAYGKELGADVVAWIEVQKVSNLIMNMNVYLSDVATGKSVFVHSVDIRGNTDESWSRSLTYLLENYFLDAASQ